MEFFISMSETIKYNDDDHKTVFLKTLNEQRLEGEFCDIAIVVEDVKFRAHRCVLAACSTYFKKLFKKLEVDSSSVIEIDFLRSDIFEEVLNYMYTAKISVKKEDVNLMMSSGQILGIRFLDKLCTQKRDVSSPEENTQSKSKYCLKMNRSIGEPNDTQDDEVEEIGDHDDSPSDVTVEGTPPSQEDAFKVSCLAAGNLCTAVLLKHSWKGEKPGTEQDEVKLQIASKQIVQTAILRAVQQVSQESQQKEKRTNSSTSLQLERGKLTKKHEKK